MIVLLVIVLAIVWTPFALLALLLWPIVWLLGIPFRLVGISVRSVLELIETILRLPARLLGGRDR
mgnify:CR=1 FL=1